MRRAAIAFAVTMAFAAGCSSNGETGGEDARSATNGGTDVGGAVDSAGSDGGDTSDVRRVETVDADAGCSPPDLSSPRFANTKCANADPIFVCGLFINNRCRDNRGCTDAGTPECGRCVCTLCADEFCADSICKDCRGFGGGNDAETSSHDAG